MTRPRLILAIRCAVLALALFLGAEGVWLVPVALFMPVFATATCIIFNDDFNRADSTSLGANWSETNGDWSISSNKLTLASPADGKIALYTGAGIGSRVSASISGGSSGDKPGLIFGYSDANNYDAVFLHFHSSAPQIIRRRRVSGSNTDFTLAFPGLTVGSTHTLLIDFDTTTIGTIEPRVIVYVDGDLAYTCDDTVLGCDTLSSSAKWGVACGGGSGAMTWDDFTTSYNYNDTASCPKRSECGCCPPGSVTEWEINILGATNPGTCTNFTAVNGIFTITEATCINQTVATITGDTPACDVGGHPVYYKITFYRGWFSNTFGGTGCLFAVLIETKRVDNNVTQGTLTFVKFVNGQCTSVHTLAEYGTSTGVAVTVEGIP